MGDKFYFVDGLQADKQSKKLMRRHVMKGKNVGKTLHRSSRLGLARSNATTSNGSQVPALRKEANSEHIMTKSTTSESLPVGRSIRTALLTVPLPVHLTKYSIEVINEFFACTAERMFPAHLGISLYDTKLRWLPVIFEDEAAYECNLALMQACNELFLHDGVSSPKALYHLSQTFAQVKKRLAGVEALSDSTITIVLSLIYQEQIRNEYSAARVHADGLRRIVDLRGGLAQLEGNIPLLLKVCKTDLMFAFQHGGPPMFFRDNMAVVRLILASKGLKLEKSSVPSLTSSEILDSRLYDVLIDVMNICGLFNNITENCLFEARVFEEIHISLSYRLLKYRSLERSTEELDTTHTAWHLGLCMFLMTIFLQYGPRRIINYDLVSLCLRDLLERRPTSSQDNELWLWLMVIGNIWVSDGTRGDWLIPIILAAARQMGLNTWEKAQPCLTSFPWINSLHDEPGRRLWAQFHET